MSYSNQAIMSMDNDLRLRIAACAATQGVEGMPITWADAHLWQLAASPGWDDAYSYAINTQVERPGNSDAVITDNQILSAVQLMLTPVAPSI